MEKAKALEKWGFCEHPPSVRKYCQVYGTEDYWFESSRVYLRHPAIQSVRARKVLTLKQRASDMIRYSRCGVMLAMSGHYHGGHGKAAISSWERLT